MWLQMYFKVSFQSFFKPIVSLYTFEHFVAFFIFDEIEVKKLSGIHSKLHEPSSVESFIDRFPEILVLIFEIVSEQSLLQLAFLVFRTH